MKEKEFIEKLIDLKHKMITKQVEVNNLIRELEIRNQDELWITLDLLIEEYEEGKE